MKQVAIFGCGAAGQRASLYLRPKHNIVAFLDNNRQWHGARVLGVPVYDPEEFNYSQVAHVFIASMYFDEILVQLLSLDVPSSKIEYLGDDILLRDSHYQPYQSIRFLPSLNMLRRLFYVLFRLIR